MVRFISPILEPVTARQPSTAEMRSSIRQPSHCRKASYLTCACGLSAGQPIPSHVKIVLCLGPVCFQSFPDCLPLRTSSFLNCFFPLRKEEEKATITLPSLPTSHRVFRLVVCTVCLRRSQRGGKRVRATRYGPLRTKTATVTDLVI